MNAIPDTGSFDAAAADVEIGLIGGLFHAPARIGPCALTGLEASHFLDQSMGAIWDRMRRAAAAGDHVDVRTIMQGGISATMGESLTPIQFEARMISAAGIPASLVSYAKTIKAYWAMRRIVEQGRIVVERAAQFEARDIVQAALAELDAVRDATIDRSKTSRGPVASIAGRLAQNVEMMLAGNVERPPASGLDDLDKRLPQRGLAPGSLHVLAGRTGMGKTLVASALASRIARRGCGVVFFSLEVPAEEIAARIVCERLGRRAPTYGDVLCGHIAPPDLEDFKRVSEQIEDWPLHIDDTPGLSMADIGISATREAARFEREGRRLSLVVIDHAQIVRASSRYAGNRVNELGEVANAAKVMAKQNGCAVVLCSQVNRSVEGRGDDKRPTLSDLRASGEVEEAADSVLMLYREAYYLQKSTAFRSGDPEAHANFAKVQNLLEIGVEKSRQGTTGRVVLWCDPGRSIIDTYREAWV